MHSHLGEGFAGNWAINKNRYMLFGQCFVQVTDCYAIWFILSYDGNNQANLRLQMRLMCWDMDIVHQNDFPLVDANYWLRLGADICFNPHFKLYLDFDQALWFPALTTLSIKPEKNPYYCGPPIITPTDTPCTTPATVSQTSTNNADASHCQNLFLAMIDRNYYGVILLMCQSALGNLNK